MNKNSNFSWICLQIQLVMSTIIVSWLIKKTVLHVQIYNSSKLSLGLYYKCGFLVGPLRTQWCFLLLYYSIALEMLWQFTLWSMSAGVTDMIALTHRSLICCICQTTRTHIKRRNMLVFAYKLDGLSHRAYFSRGTGASCHGGRLLQGHYYARLSYWWRNRRQQFYPNSQKKPLTILYHRCTRIIRDMDKNRFLYPWNLFTHLHNFFSSAVNREDCL